MIRDGCCDFDCAWRGRKALEMQRPKAHATHRRSDRRETGLQPICALDQVEHPGALDILALRQFDPELRRPGDDRAEQQLIVKQDDDAHRQHRRADRRPIASVIRLGDVGADAGQGDGRVADRDRLRGDDEEPAAGHRHHRVPDEARHRERRFELPELLPAGEAKAARDFIEIGRHGAQRLVERKGHVPGLAGEDGEDRRQFRAQRVAGEEAEEEGHGEGEKAQDRHRLQDVEHRDQHHFGAPALGRERRVSEGEHQRSGERREHAQHRPKRIVREF